MDERVVSLNEEWVRAAVPIDRSLLKPSTAAACFGVRAGARCAAAMGRTGSRGVVCVRGPRTAGILQRRRYAYTEILGTRFELSLDLRERWIFC